VSAGEIVVLIALVIFAGVFPITSALGWPRFLAAVRAGDARVRGRSYLEVIAVQWSLTAPLIAGWLADGRTLDAIGLGVAPSPPSS